jgi:hypothetical protein
MTVCLIVAVLISGCGSTGGSTQSSAPPPTDQYSYDIPPECQGLGGFGLLVCISYQDQIQKQLQFEQGINFTAWSRLEGPETLHALGLGTDYAANSGTVTSVAGTQGGTWYAGVEYDLAKQPQELSLYYLAPTALSFYDLVHLQVRNGQGYAFRNLSAAGQPGFDVALATGSSSPVNPFVAGATGSMVLAANPYAMGWEYQSFGIWNVESAITPDIHAVSFGAPTPVSGIPTLGTATFSGKLGGLYVSPLGQGALAFADVSVSADFSARTLGFSSTGTTTTRDLAVTAPAPSLNLSGTLTYAAGSGYFSGTLNNAGGTLSGTSSGQFYGPAAEELGGAFRLRSASSVETFTGAYGAKR